MAQKSVDEVVTAVEEKMNKKTEIRNQKVRFTYLQFE